jgi:hypothetical protein
MAAWRFASGRSYAVRHVELKISITEGNELFDLPRVQRRESPLDERDGGDCSCIRERSYR